MKHVGDITKLDGAKLPVVDVITGGSPCQDLSIAGARAGLAGERSGLFMEQMRIVKEMRDADRERNGRTDWNVRPRYMVWENVPGAFSSNGGKDFSVVLTEIARIVSKEAPDVPVPDKGWPKAGCLFGVGDDGCGFSIAYRLHDAQFWGVPQRRKRIALVADFGGLSAPEILFERQGMRWDTTQSGETRKGTSTGAGESVTGTIGFTNRGYESGDAAETLRAEPHGAYPMVGTVSFQERFGKPGGGKGILIQNEHTGALSTSNNQSVCAGFCTEHSEKARGIGYQEEMAPTLRAGTVPAATMSLNSKQLGLDTAVELASTLGASDYKEPQSVLSFDPSADRYAGTTFQDVAKTLTPGTAPGFHDAVAYGMNRERCGAIVGEEVMPTLQAAAGESGNNKPMVYVKTARPKFKGDAETIVESETAPTLNTFDTGDKRTSVFCLQGNGIDRADTAGCNGKGWTEDVSYTLNTIDRPAVVLNDQGGSVMNVSCDVIGALRCQEHGHQPAVLIENHPQDSRVQIREDGIVQTLDARMGMGGGNVPMVMEHRDDSVGKQPEQRNG